ncbi:MAG: thiamine diphosphokinase [Ruthenibacterium sp.]
MNRRCVIFAGLAVPPHLCQDIGPQDVILAADAGWKTARALGFAPTLALGDFDTAPAPKGPDVLRLPTEKDDTDTFFAARKALEMGCSEVLILGGIGGRLDHTLANICTLLFLEQHGVRAWLRSETTLVRVLLPGQYKFPAQKDVYVSLFPMCGAVHGLCLRGFRYPLENAVLEPASTLGTSNEFAAQAGHVSFSQGTLIYLQCQKDR